MGEKILDEISKLNTQEKIILVEKIWDSIEEDFLEDELRAKHIQILQERLNQYQAQPENTKTWETISSKYNIS